MRTILFPAKWWGINLYVNIVRTTQPSVKHYSPGIQYFSLLYKDKERAAQTWAEDLRSFSLDKPKTLYNIRQENKKKRERKISQEVTSKALLIVVMFLNEEAWQINLVNLRKIPRTHSLVQKFEVLSLSNLLHKTLLSENLDYFMFFFYQVSCFTFCLDLGSSLGKWWENKKVIAPNNTTFCFLLPFPSET